MRDSLVIGLVFDLREDYLADGYSEEDTAEFDTEESIAAMVSALERLGHRVERIGNARSLVAKLVSGASWDIVLPMVEGLVGRNREAHVPALLELFNQPYALSDVLTMAISLDKDVAKRLVREAGIPTAEFMVMGEVTGSGEEWGHYPAFLKPAWEGTSKGCEIESKVENARGLIEVAASLRNRFQQPVIVEPYLDGVELTVGIIGNGSSARVLGVAQICMGERADPDIFTRRNKENQDALCSFEVADKSRAEQVAKLALGAYRALGCRDCCRIDFRYDSEGQPQFLEANPIPGFHPTNSDLPVLARLHGVPYDDLLDQVIRAAASRYEGILNE